MFRSAVRSISTLINGTAATRVAVIGAPFNMGQPRPGVEDGPKVIRKTGFIEDLRRLGHDVYDAGDIMPHTFHEHQQKRKDLGPDGEKNLENVLSYNVKLSEKVAYMINDKRLTITLGGDHSTAIGTIAGHNMGTPGKQMAVLWVDAHADINSGRSSGSGNMHGMPVAYLMHEMKSEVNRLPEKSWPEPCLLKDNIVYIGLRDLDNAERETLKNLGITFYDMREVDQLGLAEVLSRCFECLKLRNNKTLHLSFDVDSLDPIEAPSTGTPVPGGLTLREGLLIGEAARDTGLLKAMDIVEVNPNLGSAKDALKTAESAGKLILGTISGHRGT